MGLFGKEKDGFSLEEAQSFLAKKQYGKAAEILRTLLRRNPRDDKVKLKLADALAMSGKNEEAVMLYTELADFYARTGFIHKAIAVNKMILKISPHMPDIKQKLERLYHSHEESFKQKLDQVDREPTAKQTQEEIAAKALEKSQEPLIKPTPEKAQEIKAKKSERKPSYLNKKSTAERLEAIFPGAVYEESDEEALKKISKEPDDLFLDKAPSVPIDDFYGEPAKTSFEEPKETKSEESKAVIQNKDRSDKASKTPLFSDFTKEEFAEVARMMKLREFPGGRVIIREGDPGSSLFIITDGEVEVLTVDKKGRSVTLANLKDGDFFGEVSLLTGRPRTATIVAKTYVQMIELDKESLDKITKRFPHVQIVLEDFYQQRVNQTIEAMLKAFKDNEQNNY
jgi:tetratricopeptide (TPR) repeat protein